MPATGALLNSSSSAQRLEAYVRQNAGTASRMTRSTRVTAFTSPTRTLASAGTAPTMRGSGFRQLLGHRVIELLGVQCSIFGRRIAEHYVEDCIGVAAEFLGWRAIGIGTARHVIGLLGIALLGMGTWSRRVPARFARTRGGSTT